MTDMRYPHRVSSQRVSSQEKFWLDMANNLQVRIFIL